MKINENATSGATSAGAIASVSGGLNYPLISRLPKSMFYVDLETNDDGVVNVIENKPKKTKK